MNFSELRQEYERFGIDENIYGIVRELAGSISRKYPEEIYNSGLSWDEQAFSDLAQEVVLNHLLDEGQLDYIFTVATSVESVRRLITRQVKRALHKRRTITAIDRLMKRIAALAESGQIETLADPISVYRAVGSTAQWQPISPRQEVAAVDAARGVPVLYSRRDASRESQVFTTPALKLALHAFFSVCPALSEDELRRILEKLLTPWAPTDLVPIENSSEVYETPMLATRYDELDAAARAWIESLTLDECTVFYLRSRDVSDGEAAKQIGRSRATVVAIKKRVLKMAGENFLSQFEQMVHVNAVRLAQEHCARRLGGAL